MKKALIYSALVAMAVVLMSSCNKNPLKGYEKTENGHYYKMCVDAGNPKAKVGDIIVCEVWVYIADTISFTNAGAPSEMFLVQEPAFPGDFNEGLTKIGKGDSAVLVLEVDSLVKYAGMRPLDDQKYVYYAIKVQDVYSQAESETRREEQKSAQNTVDAEIIKNYLAEKKITAEPTASGLVVEIIKKGKGAKVQKNDRVKVNYTGRLLDGTIFDSSLEAIAKEGGLMQEGRTYEPFVLNAGVGQVIAGWDEALLMLRQGDMARIIVPSGLAYGPRDAGDRIKANSVLVFEIEVLEINPKQ